MSNHYSSSLLDKVVESLLNNSLGFLVQGTSSLIQNKKFWLPYNSPCDSDSLLLPSRQLTSFDSAVDVIPIFHLHILLASISLINVTSFWLELSVFRLLSFQSFQLFQLLFINFFREIFN
jgi:hypothetical protein